MRNLLLVSVATLGLAGCVTQQERFAANCSGYGFQPGTAAYAQCMQGETHNQRAWNTEFWRQQGEARQRNYEAQMRSIQNNQPTYPTPTQVTPQQPIRQTYCTPVGNSLNCTTY